MAAAAAPPIRPAAAPVLDARTAWSCVATLFMGPEQHGRFGEVAASLGVNPGAMKALIMLHTLGDVPMRDLASELHCDASTITQIVDVLEREGLAERVPTAHDRRVKLVRLTRRGAKAYATAMAHLSVPPAALTALPASDQATLARILLKALSLSDPPLEPPTFT